MTEITLNPAPPWLADRPSPLLVLEAPLGRAHIHSHLTLSTAHGATSLGATRHCSCMRVDRHAWLLPRGGCQCPTMYGWGLFLFRKPGTHTLAPPRTLTVTPRTLCGSCGLWCLGVSVCVFRVFFLSLIRRSRHGRVVRWALGPGPRESVARPARGGCARQRAWTQ